MRVLVAHVYSFKNKGDAAIVISLLREIERAFDKPDILIQSTDSVNDADKYGYPVTSSLLWQWLSSVREASILWRLLVPARGLVTLGLFLLCARLGFKPYFLLTKDLQEFVRTNEEADLIIGCGGGYLRFANKSVRETILLMVTCVNMLTPKYLGKKVYLYSQSIGPAQNRLQRWMLKFTLKRMDLIEPREDVSVQFLKSLHLNTPTVPTADAALLLGDTGKMPKGIRLKPGKLQVGITVRKWFKKTEDLERYMQAVADTIDYLAEEHNAQVYYIPQVIAENFGDDDRQIAQKVWERTRNKKAFTVIDADLHPFEAIGLCGKMDIFIGTRMHSNIFALINYVPVVAIEYEHKTRGIMRGLGLEDLTIDIQGVTAGTLRARVDELLNHRDRYVASIKKHLPKQIKESRKAIEVIKDQYEETA